MEIYSLKGVEEFIHKYVHEYSGHIAQIKEGCLGLGEVLLHGAPGKKSVVIKEVFLNEWSSGHTIRMYNKLPKRYENLI